MPPEIHNRETITAALARLDRELTARGYHVAPITPGCRQPSLTVCHPAVPDRALEITADSEWFWWPSDFRIGRIAAITDAVRAARLIVHVLHLGCDCHE
jgi:hypothetical protein